MKTNIVLEGLRRRWMDSIVWRASGGARSTKILFCRVQEVLDRHEPVLLGSRTRRINENRVLEGSRRRRIDKNNVLEGSRRRCIDK